MKEPGLENRHRDKNGEISRKHGNTLVGTLLKQYESVFAPGFKDTEKVLDILAKLDEPSLTKLVKDHHAGVLADRLTPHPYAIQGGERATRPARPK